MKSKLNSKILKYFLDHSRVTLLALICIITFGVTSILNLKTTGFPSPEIKIVAISTIYPGASANTILEQVTKPLETNLKSIEGIETYSSTSSNNVSTITLRLAENANIDTVKSKVDSAARSVALPEGADKPIILNPRVSGDEFVFALTSINENFDEQEIHKVLEKLKKEIESDKDVDKVNIADDFEKKIVIQLDNQKLTKANLTYSDIINQLKTWDLSLPVVQNAQFSEKKYNINLSISGNNLNELKNLRIINPTNPTTSVKLSEIATIEERFVSPSNQTIYAGSREDNLNTVRRSITFSIHTSKTTDLSKYDLKINQIIKKYFDTNSDDFKKLSVEDQTLFKKYILIKTVSQADENKKQVNEVLGGLIGEKWHIKDAEILGYAGFIFGGIELVFLMMLALVSWRAALISALAIPLSFFFSTIYVKLTGNDLNTLVLFSLVLVIGLVVDPALVVLESIQRNLDNGLTGRQSAIAAIKEIGGGLFLAVLTSILVFVPFGVVSGIFGQIISYIPLTIIPALIGSYVIPLIFLSWLGSKFLKRGKKSVDDEEKNLWKLAKLTIKINKFILKPGWKSVALRIFIIVISLGIPLFTAQYYIGSGKVKQVQFAETIDAKYIVIRSENYPQKSFDLYAKENKEFLQEVMKNENIKSVASLGGNSRDITYYALLKEKSERNNLTATDIAKDLNAKLSEKFKDKFFNTSAKTLGVGPDGSSLPIAIAVKTNDLEEQKKVAKDLTEILNKICQKSGKFEINSNCQETEKAIVKIDNGFDSKDLKYVEITLLREKMLLNPVQPIEVKTILSNLFNINDGKKVGSFRQNNNDLDIILDKTALDPANIEALKNTSLRTIDGRIIKLSDIAEVKEVQSLISINRVKGEVVGVVHAKANSNLSGQSNNSKIQELAIKEFNDNYKNKYSNSLIVENYSDGEAASFDKSFSELGIAFLLAIILTYLVLVIFFNSFTQPIVILFSIPLTFLGIFPALAMFGNGQLGFLEIIGIIILVGLVENVAIFLIDAANQKIREGWRESDAIAYASGVRFRPIILTKLTTLVSTAPLAILSEQYRSLSVVIIFGLLTSGIISLFTSPILFVFFKWLSKEVRSYNIFGKILFFAGTIILPITLIIMYVFYLKRLEKSL